MITGNRDYRGPDGESQRWYLCLLLKYKEDHVIIANCVLSTNIWQFTVSYKPSGGKKLDPWMESKVDAQAWLLDKLA